MYPSVKQRKHDNNELMHGRAAKSLLTTGCQTLAAMAAYCYSNLYSVFVCVRKWAGIPEWSVDGCVCLHDQLNSFSVICILSINADHTLMMHIFRHAIQNIRSSNGCTNRQRTLFTSANDDENEYIILDTFLTELSRTVECKSEQHDCYLKLHTCKCRIFC